MRPIAANHKKQKCNECVILIVIVTDGFVLDFRP